MWNIEVSENDSIICSVVHDGSVGDFSKELDTRVKSEVANLRGKEEYELGDFVLAMDQVSKSMTEELTGKPYEAGDLSKEIDARVKVAVVRYDMLCWQS